jgi:hypothetical protein
MTISFQCPKCKGICAFHDEYAGRRARCKECNQIFTIPTEDGQKAEKVKPERGEPIPGFYRAVFCDVYRIFTNLKNVTGLVFVAAAVSFKFFVGHANYQFLTFYFPLGFITQIIAWGCLCWYYMEIVISAASGENDLPDIDMGFGLEFFWNVIKSIYLFIVALVLVEIPCVILVRILIKIGAHTPLLQHIIMLAGLLAFPMAILILSVGRGIWMVLLPQNIIKPIYKATAPYLMTVFFVMLAAALEWKTVGYIQLKDENGFVMALHLVANIAVVFFTVVAMRTVGLFGRHYNCYLPD